MKLTLVCSCGVLLECQGQKLLIDGVNMACHSFYVLPETELSKIKQAKPPYDGRLTLLFTHRHPDHYSEERLNALRLARPEVPVYTPEDTESDRVHMRLGVFTLDTCTIPHTPVPGVLCPKHMVILVSTPEESVYLTGDADIRMDMHRTVLNGKKVDAAFFNGQYLSHPETRAFMADCVRNPLIYHVPAGEDDTTGIRRKSRKSFEQYRSELPGLQLLDHYPYEITLRNT